MCGACSTDATNKNAYNIFVTKSYEYEKAGKNKLKQKDNIKMDLYKYIDYLRQETLRYDLEIVAQDGRMTVSCYKSCKCLYR